MCRDAARNALLPLRIFCSTSPFCYLYAVRHCSGTTVMCVEQCRKPAYDIMHAAKSRAVPCKASIRDLGWQLLAPQISQRRTQKLGAAPNSPCANPNNRFGTIFRIIGYLPSATRRAASALMSSIKCCSLCSACSRCCGVSMRPASRYSATRCS